VGVFYGMVELKCWRYEFLIIVSGGVFGLVWFRFRFGYLHGVIRTTLDVSEVSKI